MKSQRSDDVDANALPAFGDALDFMRLMWAIDHGLQRASKRMDATMGVTGPQRLVIRLVGRFPAISAGHLADVMHIHPSTLTGILQRLERQKLIRRRADPRDARRSLLELTPRGRRLDVPAEGSIESAVARAVDRTTPAQLRAAREVLEAIAKELE